MGERLFDPKVWKPDRWSVARGLALGVFIALTPTLGVQLVLTALLAYALRVNLPVALAACWITNPATAPVIYALEFRLGLWLSGPVVDTEGTGGLRQLVASVRPLWVGSLVAGTFAAAAGYGLVLATWRFLAGRPRRRPPEPEGLAGPPPAGVPERAAPADGPVVEPEDEPAPVP